MSLRLRQVRSLLLTMVDRESEKTREALESTLAETVSKFEERVAAERTRNDELVRAVESLAESLRVVAQRIDDDREDRAELTRTVHALTELVAASRTPAVAAPPAGSGVIGGTVDPGRDDVIVLEERASR
jgi:hypothetical protein